MNKINTIQITILGVILSVFTQPLALAASDDCDSRLSVFARPLCLNAYRVFDRDTEALKTRGCPPERIANARMYLAQKIGECVKNLSIPTYKMAPEAAGGCILIVQRLAITQAYESCKKPPDAPGVAVPRAPRGR